MSKSMNKQMRVSVPSRICLFGEHQDYLGLEVIAAAINLRFTLTGLDREDSLIHIKIRDENINYLGAGAEMRYEERVIDLSRPILYENNRDYLKSCINVLLKKGYRFKHGFDVVMDSQIPIGKGMCSSTTMLMSFMRFLLEALGAEEREIPEEVAKLGFAAEVTEFNEPGGMMDHFCAAFGGLLHLSFGESIGVEKFDINLPGSFILFDSLETKNTTKVLADAKTPVVNAMKELKEKYGVGSIRDFLKDNTLLRYTESLDEIRRRKLLASIGNYRLLKEAEKMLKAAEKMNKASEAVNHDTVIPNISTPNTPGSNTLTPAAFDMNRFGELIRLHHANLRDGLNISTPRIESIFDAAYENGALGGKLNGSGGGGCGYVYAPDEDCGRIIKAIHDLGYPAQVLKIDSGMKVE